MLRRYVYILRSLKAPDRRYVGVTSNVNRRLEAHNAGSSPSTAKYRPWVVTTLVEFEDGYRAAAFERYLKTGSGRAFARKHFAVDLSTPVEDLTVPPDENLTDRRGDELRRDSLRMRMACPAVAHRRKWQAGGER
jgi:predicted GIY-YIG superfamily endonuclease